MPGPNLVYQIFQAEDGSVALADNEGGHITYRTNWGDMLHYLREAHWAQGGPPAMQDNVPTTERGSWSFPRVARGK